MSTAIWYSNKTQVYWTCQALLKGRTISHKTEIREVNGWRLGAIIYNLKKNYDWPIDVEYRGPETIAYYTLRPGTDKSKLRFPKSAQELADEVVA